MKKYQMCSRCVMDNASDETIYFNSNGFCNYCTVALSNIGKTYYPNEIGEQKLTSLISKLKTEGKNKKYDCLMGLSGGLDSSYLAYLGSKKWGLRILGIHVDDGFDIDLAKKNVENLCKSCNIDLIIEKPDAEQFYDLTRSFILAEVPNIAIPQDNVLIGCLYECAKQNNIFNFLSGGNFALESILQRGNTYEVADLKHILDIHKKFGTKGIDKLPIVSKQKIAYYTFVNNIKFHRPLDLIDYNKQRAIDELASDCGFKYYEAKHLENIFTAVTQQYWFYKKFKVDKRHSHLSSLIVSGQLTREDAIADLRKPLFDEHKMDQDINFVLKKLNLAREEFDEIIQRPGKSHTSYKHDRLYPYYEKILKLIINILKKLFRR